MCTESRLGLLFLMIVISIATGCATTKSDFDKANRINQIEAYELFLKNHPKGKFSQTAQENIEHLRWEKAKAIDTTAAYDQFLLVTSKERHYKGKGEYRKDAKSRIEELDFQKVKTIDNIDAYITFLKRHPKENLFEKANSRLEELQYQEAKKINTSRSYQTFLQNYPDGKFSEETRTHIETLEYKNAKSVDVLKCYKDFLHKFPESQFNSSVRARIEDITFKNAISANSEIAIKQFLTDYPKSRHYKDGQSRLSELRFQKIAHMNTDKAYIDFLLEFPSSPLSIKAIARLQNHVYKFITRSQLMTWHTLNTIFVKPELGDKEAFPFGLKLNEFSIKPPPQYHRKYKKVEDTYFFQEGFILDFEDWTRFSKHICKGQAVVNKQGLKFLSGSEIIQPKQ